MGQSLGGKVRDEVVGAVGEPRGAREETGPIRTLVSQIAFERVHLLSNYPEGITCKFAEWLDCHAEAHQVVLNDPTNYESVFEVANKVLTAVWSQSQPLQERLCIHLSPGTPTMAAVWVLLGKTRFPATLYQTHRGTVREETIPFDIQVDFLPELLRDPDRSLQTLAAASPGELEGFEEIVGESAVLQLAKLRAERTAIREVNVLLLGESGTGKELFARAMHRASHRGRKDARFEKFVALNCAAIPRELLEGELFGVTRGAATQTEERPGAFELAHGGTLLLDEVGECSLDHQAKLLRALQPRPGDEPCTRWIRRVGGKSEMPFNVRIVAATNRNLLEAVSERSFRDDLYYRLATVTVELPSLRARRADIPLLARDRMNHINGEFARTEPGYQDKNLSAPAIRCLREHHWPGNVRELNNVLVQAAVMSVGNTIGRGDIESAIVQMPSASTKGPFSRERAEKFDLRNRLEEVERAFVFDALDDSNGNQTEAAKLLGISQQALSKKLKGWKVD
jgi:transcriptional regulator with PAS, ATPase and Fis domain